MVNKVSWFVNSLALFVIGGWMLVGCQSPGQQPTGQGQATASATPTATVTQTPTVTPTFTPPPPPTLIAQQPPATRPALPCRDGLALVMELSFEPGADGALPVIPATSQIEKGWRVRNSGTCTWDSAYVLMLTEDAPGWVQQSQAEALATSVKPGEMHDFWVQVEAPPNPGSHQADWVLRNGRGRGFGEPLSLSIEVAPLPTGTPLPDVSLVAEPLEVFPGQQARIAWTTNQVKEAYFYRSGQAWREHPVDVNGSAIVQPDRTTTYELRVVKGDGRIEIRRITIEILTFDAPEIRVFRLVPGNVIELGQCVTIQWRVTGRVNTLTVFRDGVEYWSSMDEAGEVTDCPGSRRVLHYLLQAVGPGGEAQAERQLEVR